MNKAFTFYESFYDAINDLEDKDRLAVYDAICRYGITGEEPETTGIVSTVFKLIRPNIDANIKMRDGGKKGGENKPKKPEEATPDKGSSEDDAHDSQATSKPTASLPEASPKPTASNKTRQEKNKTRKDINTNCAPATSKKEVDALFEELWQLYPDKKGKGKVSAADKRRLYEIGRDHMQRAISRYVDGLKREEWRHPQNGSTFFHSGYIDYLDQNYSPPDDKPPNARSGTKPDPIMAGKGKTGFSNFEERRHDFDELEKQLGGWV